MSKLDPTKAQAAAKAIETDFATFLRGADAHAKAEGVPADRAILGAISAAVAVLVSSATSIEAMSEICRILTRSIQEGCSKFADGLPQGSPGKIALIDDLKAAVEGGNPILSPDVSFFDAASQPEAFKHDLAENCAAFHAGLKKLGDRHGIPPDQALAITAKAMIGVAIHQMATDVVAVGTGAVLIEAAIEGLSERGIEAEVIGMRPNPNKLN